VYSTFLGPILEGQDYDNHRLSIDISKDINIIIFVLFIICYVLIIKTYKEHIGFKKSALGVLVITLYKLLETIILYLCEREIDYNFDRELLDFKGFNYAYLVAPILSTIALLIFMAIYLILKTHISKKSYLFRYTALDAIILYIGTTSFVFNYDKFIILLILGS
jgi:hypothetical protein